MPPRKDLYISCSYRFSCALRQCNVALSSCYKTSVKDSVFEMKRRRLLSYLVASSSMYTGNDLNSSARWCFLLSIGSGNNRFEVRDLACEYEFLRLSAGVTRSPRQRVDRSFAHVECIRVLNEPATRSLLHYARTTPKSELVGAPIGRSPLQPRSRPIWIIWPLDTSF